SLVRIAMRNASARTMPLVTSRLRLRRRRMFCQAISTALLNGREIWRWIGAAEAAGVVIVPIRGWTMADGGWREERLRRCHLLSAILHLRLLLNSHCDQTLARERLEERDGGDLGLALVEIVA